MTHATHPMLPKLWTLLLLASLAACGGRGTQNPVDAPAKPAAAGDEHSGEDHADEEHGDEARHVELSAEQIQAADIGLAEAGPAPIRTTLPLYGTIAPDAQRVRDVSARYPGVIRSVSRAVGDTVRQGETLATVESNESLKTYPVIAPLSGVVTARMANPGEQTGDRALFTLADLSSVWVELALFPRDLAKVRVGQEVIVRGEGWSQTGQGRLVFVAPIGNSASQTLVARAELPNASRSWAPGLYVTAEVTLDETKVPVAVRSEALQTLEGQTVVFVRGEHGFEPRALRLGRSDGTLTEVLEGLKGGETYAAANSFVLKSELGKGEAEHAH